MAAGFQTGAFQSNAFQQTTGAKGQPNADLSQLDKGIVYQSLNTYRGPTLGWAMSFIKPARVVVSSTTLSSGDSVILLTNRASFTITLPNVAAWVKENFDQPYTPFERCIWIKDLTGAADVNPITILPADGQKIDLLSSFTLALPYGALRFYPLADFSGWYVG